jgi:predicted membrane protein
MEKDIKQILSFLLNAILLYCLGYYTSIIYNGTFFGFLIGINYWLFAFIILFLLTSIPIPTKSKEETTNGKVKC